MITKITQAVIGGIIATTAMSIVMFLAPMMGMPKMSPPEMLSMMMGFPIIVGWMMHFMIGIIFAMSYAFFFIGLVKKVNNTFLKGIIFGLSVFIFGQIAIAILGAIFGGVPPMEGSMMLIVIGSIIGHLLFGIVVALFVKEKS